MLTTRVSISCFLFQVFVAAFEDGTVVPFHYQISDYILKRYNSDLVPQERQNDSVKIFFSMELYQIIDVNEPQQYLMLNAWIVERWYDKLIRWRPDDFGNVTEIMIPHSRLWLPDTTLYNSLVMEDRDTRRLLNAKVTMKNEGAWVELLYPTIYKLSCNIDLRFFPFDVQVCKLIFGSWTFDNTYIDYWAYNVTHAIGTSNCIENEGWVVLGTKVIRRVEKYACCPNNYTLLDFYLHIQRKPLYYVINLITPTSIITLISIVGFFSTSSINEMREEKISLGITTLLSMSILIFMVSDKMPSTSSFIPLIGWFYTSMIFLISMSTLMSSLVIYVQKQGALGKPPSKGTVKYARVIGKFVYMELPLLMKQAYAAKAREDRLRNKKQRKESIWQKMYKMSKTASAPRALNVNFSEDEMPPPSVEKEKKKSLTINNDVIKINGTNGIPEYIPMHDADEDTDTYIDDYKEDIHFPSKFLHKTSTCASFDSILRTGVEETVGDYYFWRYRANGNMPWSSSADDLVTPRTAQRNLAELEFDWLAAVIERVCLIVFLIFFFLMSFGINSIGWYWWWTARVE